MKRSFLLISFIFSYFTLLAQGLPSFEGNKSTSSVLLQKVVPPSPTAASLGKYGDRQINMFTGTSAINIPIYEIKTNGFSVPLSIAYSSSGLRVTEAASPTGLGWSLAGTGVVTRVVKGVPDGILNPVNIRTWPLPLSYTNVNDNAWYYIHSAIQIGLMDPEPDIFIAKAGKLSVKFYYDLHKRIQTIPYTNDIRIEFDAGLDQYTVADNDGTRYFFGGSLATEITMSTNPTYANYTTSWFLTKIITPVGAQILYNNSKGVNTILQDQYSESEEVKPAGQGGNCAANSAAGRNSQWNIQTFYPVFLNSIETDQEIVYLTRDVNQRADMPGDYALTDIRVYSKSSGKYEFNYSFVYSYFPQVSSICWGNNAFPNHPHNLAANCKQLRLDRFIEKGFEGNTAGFKTYQFQYSNKPVPSRCSLDQDFWGYYNGAGNTSLLPAVTDPDFQGSLYNAVSREANPNYGDAGMLQKIIYPTGGETDFVYEPNEVNSVSTGPAFQTVNTTLSGMSPSLESSITFTITSTQPVTLSFTLSDPNLADQGLQRRAQIIDPAGIVKYVAINTDANGLLVTGNPVPIGGLTPGTYTLKVSRNYLYSSYPSVPPVSIIASVTYAPSGATTVATRKIGGFRIKKVLDKTDPIGNDVNVKEFSYSNTYFVADIKNSDCISNYHRWFIYYVQSNPTSTYECYFRSRTTSSVQPIGSVQGSHIAYGKVTCSYGTNGSNGKTEFFYSTDPDQGGFSLTPYYRPITSYDHRRGNLLSQVDYDAAGNIKRIKANNYEYILKNTGLFSSAYYTKDEPLIGIVNVSLIGYKDIAFKDFALPGEWVRIKNMTETVFDGPTYISTIKEFSYDNPNYTYVTQTKTTNSKGSVITELNKYPLDSKPVSTKSIEEIERQFDTDYQTLFNNFYTCDNAVTNGTAVDACYTTYQTAYDNLVNSRTAALANYESTFTTLANGTADPVLKGKYQLIAKNKVAELIERRVTKDVSTELSKKTNDFKEFSGNILPEKVNNSFLGNTLENEVTINSYDTYGNILQATPKDGIIKSFIWDYQYKYPVAEVSNATTTNIAYTSFEADGKGNWTFSGMPVQDGTAPTGRKVYNLSAGAVTKAVTSSVPYFISYWRPVSLSALIITGTQAGYPISGRTVNGWKFIEHKVTGISSASISGSGFIDELRLYPATALISTSTYEPLKGITSRCDALNRITYYDYDVFGRLVLIRDQDRNVLKKICYNYAGQPENCNLYVNTTQEGTFYKQGCTGCQAGSAVIYPVQAGLYSSTLSPDDANSKAQAEIAANGQANANAKGTCIVAPVVPVSGSNVISTKSFSLQFHNNCTSINYNFTLNPSVTNVALTGIPQGNYTVTMSAVGGGSIQYTYRVNAFTQHTIAANITVDLVPAGNQVIITP